jgi:hypothetical protein
VTADTKLGPHPDIVWRIEADTEHAHLHFHGKAVSVPWHALSTLRWIAAAQEFTVGDIPGDLESADRYMLAQLLLDQGFLQRA